MCGIVGYVGRAAALDVITAGLTRLDYRGYDSAGVGVVVDHRIVVRRTLGRIGNLVLDEPGVRSARVGIGHTRWATHGRPSVDNAHPQVDCSGRVAVVHNGIIENHRALREALTARGHHFRSDTDTEVVAHLLEEHGGGIDVALRKVAELLHGEYALAVLLADAPDAVAAVRAGSPPLIIGVGDGEHLLASDLLPLAGRAAAVVPLEDGDVAVVTGDAVEVTGRDGAPSRRAPVPVAWTAGQAERGSHPHFMHKEIYEQPEAVRKTVAGRVAPATGEVRLEGQPVTRGQWRTRRQVTIVGCGTSYHAGLIGRRLFERLARLRVDVDVASEFRYREPLLGPRDLVVLISQSGETADTLGALRTAREAGTPVVAVCNVPGSSLTRAADGVLLTRTGPEIGVASTKAFTGQIVALLLLALDAARQRETLDGEAAGQLLADLADLPGRLARVLAHEERIAELARRCRSYRDFYFLGRGLAHPVALEGALKLKEIAYVHAEAFPAGEMKHGPLALIDERAVAVVLAPAGGTHAKMLSTMEEVRARDGRILALATEGDGDVARLADWTITVPAAGEWLTPCLLTLPLQLFAYHAAVLAGHDVDRPRNLAKSVTVE